MSAAAPCDESRPSKPRLRWKKNEALTGLARIDAGPRGSCLHDGKTRYASVSALSRYARNALEGWYWVTPSAPGIPWKNTCDTPCKTEGDAKKAAMEYVKACLAGGSAK